MKKLMTGNEAIARGAYEAGVKYASAYPGTPSTEIMENTATYKDDILAEWAPNEKVALESVIGASFAGARTFASMKHVGVNVAADPLFTIAYTGINGGMVLISADEPGQHSSQNEQDNRNYAKFAKIPMLEPSDSNECAQIMKEAFEVSEQFDIPTMIRLTTRICHSKGLVEISDRKEVPFKDYVKDVKKYVAVPNLRMRANLERKLEGLKEYSENSPLNYIENNNSKIGVVASGACHYYAKEVFGDDASYLKLGFTHPLPDKLMLEFSKLVDTIYVIEENDPYLEDHLKMLGIKCIGKDLFPKWGELTPDVIRKCVFDKNLESAMESSDRVIPRPPTLCPGCPHRGFFHELGKLKDVMISGDIGCYTLGFDKPYEALDTTICMGGSISMGHGAQQVFDMKDTNKKRVVSVLGDSTFFHTGINSLLDVVYNGSNTINVILDNRITGMTGHQENPSTGYTLQGKKTKIIEIEPLVRACGIEHVKMVDPNNLKEMKETLKWAMDIKDSPSVIITRWPCVLKKFSSEDREEFKGAFTTKFKINHEKCIGCKKCIKTGCPSLSFNKETKKASIDPNQCVGCSVCSQTCPVQAISKEEK